MRRLGVCLVVGCVVGFSSVLVLPGSAFGAQNHLIAESDVDKPGGSEVYVVSFDSLADFYSHTAAAQRYTETDMNSTWSLVGFAFDGAQYHLIAESDVDQPSGSEVYVFSFDSLADFYSQTAAAHGYTETNMGSTWSVVGFASEKLLFADGFESGDTTAWSAVAGELP